jgi:cysteine desulfurase/selenocysteine lyase
MNIKKDFPIFAAHPNLVYLDSAATSQKPQIVIDAISNFYTRCNAPSYRSTYRLAEAATEQLEHARATCAAFINASSADTMVFTKGATDGISCVAFGWAHNALQPGDEIVVTECDHHSNLLPWYEVAQKTGAVLRWITLNPDGTINHESLISAITPRTKLVAITAYSHVFGSLDALVDVTERPVIQKLITRAHAFGARVLLDAAQWLPHYRLDVQKVPADFVVCSSHKMMGPHGAGFLYVTPELHDQFEPYQRGGGTTFHVDHETAFWRDFPHVLEAGTLPLANIVGFEAALRYLTTIGFDDLRDHEARLFRHCIDELRDMSPIRLLAPVVAQDAQSLISFNVEDMHAHDVAAFLDMHNIAVRAGNHCAQIAHKALNVPASVRASFYGYTTHDDIDRFITALRQLPMRI